VKKISPAPGTSELKGKIGEKRQKGSTALQEAVQRLNQQYAMAGFWQLSFGMSAKITAQVEKSGSWFRGLSR
jgi:hypothetical protein